MTGPTSERIEDRYLQILDAAPDAMVIVEPDARISYVNRQTEKLFGYAASDMLGAPLDTLIPERFRGDHGSHVERYFAAPVPRPMGSSLALFGRRADGSEVEIEVSLSPVYTREGPRVAAAIRDITDRRRIEAEARAAQKAAEVSSAAKSEFLSSMSHELRTPLNAILGFAQLLVRDKKEPLSPRHTERAAQIIKGGEHLLRLIDDILDLSRIEAGRISISTEPVGVLEVLDEVRTTLESAAVRNRVTLAVVPSSAPVPTVSVDRTRFAQILMNFGSNAIKYNRPGGSVTISTSDADGRVRVTVSDTGMGIPVDKQDKIFQPFQRAGHESGPIEGTGIGLVISKRLAEFMQGEVGFDSVPGEGSRFWVEVPVHTRAPVDKEQPLPGAPDPRRDPAAPHCRVLYVEDNPANIAFMRDLVEGLDGFELTTAPTAEMGIEIARREPPDVVLMDINLPGMSGFDALRELHDDTRTRHVPVVALTAAASERDKQRGVQAGFYRYLTKPIRVDELYATLEELERARPA